MTSPHAGIGRRKGLKIPRYNKRGGSIPSEGTTLKQRIKYIIKSANYRKLLDSDLDYRNVGIT